MSDNKISANQLKYSIACYLLGSILLSSFAFPITLKETWIVIISGYLVSLIFICIYIAIAKRFPGKNIIQINDAVFGKVIGKIISIFYILYFFALTVLNTRDLGNFTTGYVLPGTPITASLIPFIFICAWAVNNDIFNFVKYAFSLTVLFGIIILTNSLLLIENYDIRNMLPTFSLPFVKYVHGTHLVSMIPFTEVFVFTMIFPFMDKDGKFNKAVISGVSLGAIAMLFLTVRDTLVLGPLVDNMSMPSFEVVRLINIANILTRLEITFAVALLFLQFYRITIMYYCTVLAFTEFFKLKSYKTLILPLGIIIISSSLLTFPSIMENVYFAHNAAIMAWAFITAFLPLATYIIVLIRNMKEQ
ncbi:MAG TPA: endospore germination permease [Clostridia bacterium]|nr:endospore germination permease [Clostridia bacterium]